MTEDPDKSLEMKTICGVTHYKRKCSVCGEKIWSSYQNGHVACNDCVLPTGAKDFGQGTGGGRRINHKGSQES